MLAHGIWNGRLGSRAWTAAQRLRSRLPHRPPPAILNYHRIAEEPFDPWGVTVSPDHFREHLSWLARNRTVLRLQEFADLHRRGELPANAVAVTLDDGYVCNSDVAAPLLNEYQIPATLFISVNVIARGKPFWWDELEEIVLRHDGATLTFDGEEVSLGERSPADRRWPPRSPPGTPRQAAFYDLHVRLSRKRPAELEKAMDQLRRQATQRHVSASTKRPMTGDEVRRTASRCIEFGSHTLNHPWLTSLDLAEQRHEICDSVEQCRSLTGSRPAAFAYPYGTFDEQSERLVKEAGFDCACATGGVAVSRRSRTFALPRIQVGDWDAAGLERMLARVRAA